MKMGHMWVLEAKTGVKYAILAKNGPKMTISEPPAPKDKQIYTAKVSSKASSVDAFGLGYEISTKNLIKGLIILQLCSFGR